MKIKILVLFLFVLTACASNNDMADNTTNTTGNDRINNGIKSVGNHILERSATNIENQLDRGIDKLFQKF